jgi:subfamily B ATP-binding cassette protein HlyB/CyaB
VFIIAHRLSAVRRANRIITLEGGRLVEQGTHEELLRVGGRYATLFGMQAGAA